jgi:hypothetical protein
MPIRIVYDLPHTPACAVSSVRIHSGAAQDLFASDAWDLELWTPFCRRSDDATATVYADGVLYEHRSGPVAVVIYFVPSEHAPTSCGRFAATKVDGLGRTSAYKGRYTSQFTDIIDGLRG